MISNSPTGSTTADRDGGCEGQDARIVGWVAPISRVNAGRSLGLHTTPANLANVAIFSSVHGMME